MIIEYLLHLIIQIFIYAAAGINFTYYCIDRKISVTAAFAAGIGIMYTYQLFISLFPRQIGMYISIIFILLNIVLLIVNFRKLGIIMRIRNFRYSAASITGIIILLTIIIIHIIIFYRTPLHGFDGLMIYGSRAKKIFDASLFYLMDPGVLAAHNKYPLLVSLNEYFANIFNSDFSYQFTSIPHIIYILALIGMIVNLFREYTDYVFLILSIFLMTPLFLMNDLGFAYQYADFPLAVIMLSVWVSIVKKRYSLGIFLSTLLPLIKNEGWPVFFVIVIYLFIMKKEILLKFIRQRALFIISSLNLVSWIIIRLNLTSYIEEIRFQSLIANITSVRYILPVMLTFLYIMVKPLFWGLNFIIPIILLILSRDQTEEKKMILVFTLFPLLVYSIIISLIPGFASDSGDISNRLLLHFYPL
ncbi:MAG: hypothetical protein R6U31_08220, partial [bacterium]